MQNNEYYVCIFSLKLYKELKKHNIFPYEIEPNKRFPDLNVFKYHESEELRGIINKFKEENKKEVK